MTKRILCLFTVAVMIFSVFSVSASALVDTSILYGDVDGDKDVDTSDASAVLRAAAGLSSIKDASAKPPGTSLFTSLTAHFPSTVG